MELIQFSIPKSTERLVIAPIGDLQFAGMNNPNSSTAKESLLRHIDRALSMDAYFIGMGDYIDFASPSNRSKIKSMGLYEVAEAVMEEKGMELMTELYEQFLEPTKGRWIGLLEGHHFYEGAGWTTDEKLAELLKTQHIGTSAFVRIPAADLVLYGHHGIGTGMLPGVGLNKLYHVQGTLQGADVYLMGHNTRLAAAPLGRTFPVWGKKQMDHTLSHRQVHIVNTGGFSKSNILGHRQGTIKRGDYAEKGMMVPSPLRAPFIIVYMDTVKTQFNESVWVMV